MRTEAAADAADGRPWLSEIKQDGYRVQAHLEAGRPKLFTRRGYDWTPHFAVLAKAMADLPANSCVAFMLGEAVKSWGHQ